MAANRWTPEEDRILEQLWETAPMSEILAKLPRRNRQTCTQRAWAFGLARKPRWSVEEDHIIRSHFPNGGAKWVMKIFAMEGLRDRTATAIHKRAQVLGARYVKKSDRAA